MKGARGLRPTKEGRSGFSCGEEGETAWQDGPPHPGPLTLCARLSKPAPRVTSPQTWYRRAEVRRKQPARGQKQEALSEDSLPPTWGMGCKSNERPLYCGD